MGWECLYELSVFVSKTFSSTDESTDWRTYSAVPFRCGEQSVQSTIVLNWNDDNGNCSTTETDSFFCSALWFSLCLREKGEKITNKIQSIAVALDHHSTTV